VDARRRYVGSGGTLVFASDLSIFERSLSARLLEDLDVRIAGRLAPGTHDAGGIALADPPVHRIAVDQGATLTFGSGQVPLSAGTSSFAAFARVGRGAVVAIGSVGPFLTGSLGDADNGRFALALAAEAAAGGRASTSSARAAGASRPTRRSRPRHAVRADRVRARGDRPWRGGARDRARWRPRAAVAGVRAHPYRPRDGRAPFW